MFRLIAAGIITVALHAQQTNLPTITATPSALTFTYQIGTATLPAAQTFALKRTGAGAALDYSITVPQNSQWLIVTPLQGKTGGTVSVRVNPTSLLAGAYTASLQVDATGAAAAITVTVTLIIKGLPPAMAAAPASLTFTYDTDQAQPPAAQTFAVSTSGEPVSFTVAVSGATWLTLDRDTGIAMAGSPVTITASVDTSGLTPGSYTGKIAVTSTNASNKTVTIPVGLAVNPGTAVISTIWPNAAPIGSDDMTITIRGSHFFKSSVVAAGTATLQTSWVGTTVVLATIPKASLTAQGTLAVTVTNSPKPASNTVNFTVTAPGPQVQSVANAASFAAATTPSIAPGEIISIFGSGLGPAVLLAGVPSNGAFPTTLGTPATVVEFEQPSGKWTAAPIIFAQANQVNVVAPFGLSAAAGVNLRLTYNGIASSNFLFDAVAAEPGIFTVDSSGRGQAAALNYNSTTHGYSLNSAGNAAAKGSIVVLYVTGCGVTNPLPAADGQVVPLAGTPPAVAGQVSVTIGGDGASVQSATAVPGSIAGLVQLNVTVPGSIKAAKDAPIVVTVGGRASPATATLAVK